MDGAAKNVLEAKKWSLPPLPLLDPYLDVTALTRELASVSSAILTTTRTGTGILVFDCVPAVAEAAPAVSAKAPATSPALRTKISARKEGLDK